MAAFAGGVSSCSIALVTEIPARPLCTFVPRLLGVRIMRSLGSIFGFSTLANSSLMSCVEGSSVGELALLLGVCIVGELAPGLFEFGIISRQRANRKMRR